MSTTAFPTRLAGARPRAWVGAAVAVAAVAVATAAIYPLKQVAPVVSLSVVYLPAVLLVSASWGLALGVATSLLSAPTPGSSTWCSPTGMESSRAGGCGSGAGCR